MIDLRPFWEFVESRMGRTAVMFEWRKMVGEGTEPIIPLLQPLREPARAYPHPHVAWKRLKVVCHPEGSIVAIDEDDQLVRLELEPHEIVLYQLELRKFRTLAAQALLLRPSDAPIGEHALTIRIGEWEVEGSAFPAFAFLTGKRKQLVNEAQRLALNVGSPFILLTPTKRLWTAELIDLMSTRGVLVPLCEILAVSNNRWRSNGHWASYQTAFRQLVMPESLVAAPPPYEFRQEGAGWIVRYEGVAKPFGNYAGLRYIRYLLMHQGKEINIIKMLADTTGDQRVLASSDAGPEMTEEAKQNCAESLAELEEDLTRAKKMGNLVLAQEIEADKQELILFLMKAHGIGGRQRKMSDGAKRAYKSVRQCVSEMYKLFEDAHPALGMHLQAFINTGITMSYKPNKFIDWSL